MQEGSTATFTLVSGHAESCGVELAVGTPYQFPSGKVGALSTFHGCEVR